MISWESFGGLLPDGDLINVSIEPDAVPVETVEFRLAAAEDIMWWKGLLVPDGLGRSWELWTEHSKTVDSVSLWAHQVHNGQRLEFRKAKLFGVHTGVYELGELRALAPGSRVTFEWAQDAAEPLVAYIVSRTLSLPFQDGRFRAHAGETFHAEIGVQNVTDTVPWVAARRFRLGSWNPPDNTTWGLSRVELPARIPVLGTATFAFTATAPQVLGAYTFAWRMVQQGVEWFGDALATPVEVGPPPPPTSGRVTVTLTRQPSPSQLYDGTAADPSATSTYPTPRHARVASVRNDALYALHLAHQDRLLRQTPYTLMQPGEALVSPFAGLEVEGLWRAIYRGPPSTPPEALAFSIGWET